MNLFLTLSEIVSTWAEWFHDIIGHIVNFDTYRTTVYFDTFENYVWLKRKFGHNRKIDDNQENLVIMEKFNLKRKNFL